MTAHVDLQGVQRRRMRHGAFLAGVGVCACVGLFAASQGWGGLVWVSPLLFFIPFAVILISLGWSQYFRGHVTPSALALSEDEKRRLALYDQSPIFSALGGRFAPDRERLYARDAFVGSLCALAFLATLLSLAAPATARPEEPPLVMQGVGKVVAVTYHDGGAFSPGSTSIETDAAVFVVAGAVSALYGADAVWHSYAGHSPYFSAKTPFRYRPKLCLGDACYELR